MNDGPEASGENIMADHLDGAVDTLGCVLRTMGDLSFPVDGEPDPELFQGLCEQFAGHVENGAAVHAYDIPRSAAGARQWSNVRRFYIDRRTREHAFVNERLGNYQEIVQELVTGLKSVGQRDQDTETGIREHLGAVETAVSSGNLKEIKSVVSDTIVNVADIFKQQKTDYEARIRELHERMSCLREDLVQAQEEMQRDSLTEAYNRRAFDSAIARALNVHFVLNQPVTLLMIDLDNFKTVNDTLGHAAGDDVLRRIGEALARSFIRKSDFIARFGGDEFAVILTDTSTVHARPLIERFMQRVEHIEPGGRDAGLTTTCSIGLTEINSDDSVESVIERADSALYAAKNAGRNQYRMA